MNENARVVLDAIYARRSIREYVDGKPVEPEKIDMLLKAGMAAPSACNLQPWEFIVVTEDDTLKKLKATTTMGDYNAPMAMVICGNTVNTPWKGDGWMIDSSAAVENMMIMATALELGSVWIGSHDEDAVRKLLDIPDSIGVMNIAYFGYPAQTKKKRTKYTEEAVFWQKYDSKRERVMRTIDQLCDPVANE